MNKPHSSDLRKGRMSHPGNIYYLTKNCMEKPSDVLITGETPEIVIESLFWAADNFKWNLLAFVVMPDHYHTLVHLGDAASLSEVMESIGKFTSQSINISRGTSGNFWQDGFYDRSIRPHEDLNDYIDYTHMNPVRSGLVKHPEDWVYSSINERFRDRLNWDRQVVCRHSGCKQVGSKQVGGNQVVAVVPASGPEHTPPTTQQIKDKLDGR